MYLRSSLMRNANFSDLIRTAAHSVLFAAVHGVMVFVEVACCQSSTLCPSCVSELLPEYLRHVHPCCIVPYTQRSRRFSAPFHSLDASVSTTLTPVRPR